MIISPSIMPISPGLLSRPILAVSIIFCYNFLLMSSTMAQSTPSPGAILEQTILPNKPISPPAPVFEIPETPEERTNSTVKIPIKKFVIEGNTLLLDDMLLALVAPAEGKKLTFDALSQLVRLITSAYKAAGYPIAYAYLPPQKIIDGLVRIAVVEPRYDDIIMMGTSRLKTSQAILSVGVAAGEHIESVALNRGLMLLNNTPGVKVTGVLTPGSKPQSSTLQLKLKDEPVVSGDGSVTNHGSEYTGVTLLSENVTLQNPFGYGSSLSVNGLASTTGGLTSLGFSALSPNLRNGLRMGFDATKVSYTLAGSFAATNSSGGSRNIGVHLAYPLDLEPRLSTELRFDLLSNSLTTSDSFSGEVDTTLSVARLTYSGLFLDDDSGTTSFKFALSGGNVNVPLSGGSANLSDTFGKLTFEIDQMQLLQNGVTLGFGASGQSASKNLDSSEKFYLGGPNSVMSEVAGAIGGDSGVLIKLKLSRAIELQPLSGALVGSIVAQHGSAFTNQSSIKASASGIGIALDYAFKNISVNANYAVPVDGSDDGGKFWTGLTHNF